MSLGAAASEPQVAELYVHVTGLLPDDEPVADRASNDHGLGGPIAPAVPKCRTAAQRHEKGNQDQPYDENREQDH
jgi:hypothetical protein